MSFPVLNNPPTRSAQSSLKDPVVRCMLDDLHWCSPYSDSEPAVSVKHWTTSGFIVSEKNLVVNQNCFEN